MVAGACTFSILIGAGVSGLIALPLTLLAMDLVGRRAMAG
jgi:hypothetical protein